jgi:hypothetical protein
MSMNFAEFWRLWFESRKRQTRLLTSCTLETLLWQTKVKVVETLAATGDVQMSVALVAHRIRCHYKILKRLRKLLLPLSNGQTICIRLQNVFLL